MVTFLADIFTDDPNKYHLFRSKKYSPRLFKAIYGLGKLIWNNPLAVCIRDLKVLVKPDRGRRIISK